ncbi:MAG: crossover junction endodeoxyribonuclease RuvC [Candidatus Omnitrophica bacterium]|nr:crossover junction endodeoxyribonuclease RuvC [Candidatus Omnitrophota bacterium]
MRVLGIDPGTWKAGIGIVDLDNGKMNSPHYETLVLQKNRGGVPLAKRLQKIYDILGEVLKIYKPDVMALEDVFYSQSFSSAVRIGEARAVAILAATNHGVSVAEYLPTRVKQAISGNGRAAKNQVQFMVRHLLGLRENPPPDAADALAVAICHCQCRREKIEAAHV